MKPAYINVFPSHMPQIVVVTTAEGMREVADQQSVPACDPERNCQGLVRHLGSGQCLVLISLRDIDSIAELVNVITHEAVHVSQHFFEWIGEVAPSPEYQAYTIGDITSEIFKALYTGNPEFMAELRLFEEPSEEDAGLEKEESKL